MKFEKQNKHSKAIVRRHNLTTVELCDCLTSDDLVMLRKKHYDILKMNCEIPHTPSEFQEYVLQAIAQFSKAEEDYFFKRIRMAFIDRIYHSSDWKEERYLEKGDIAASLTPLKAVLDVVWNTKLIEFARAFEAHSAFQSTELSICYLNIDLKYYLTFAIFLLKDIEICAQISYLREHLDEIYVNKKCYIFLFARILAVLTWETGNERSEDLQ